MSCFILNLILTAHSHQPELAVVPDHGEAAGGAGLSEHLGLMRRNIKGISELTLKQLYSG